ncbi:MAG: glycerol-3-phosphate dehydrogenase [Hyphomicrobiales bacterium]
MTSSVDMFVVGGGINGAAVARDAAGRGLTVQLAEMGDYAGGTSSASSKLIHGGLRYLESYEFGLVRASLKEREVMLRIAPHLVFPMRFLLPITSTQPRPAFLVRLGLWLYDMMSGRKLLAPSGRLSAREVEALPRLRKEGVKAVLHYPDCWADDARLTLETLLDARDRGADIGNYREVTAIRPLDDGYLVEYRDRSGAHATRARFVANAAGPWAARVLDRAEDAGRPRSLRFVRGSHIVIKMPEPAQADAYTLQIDDKRVVFVLPWLGRYLIVGTTDADHTADLSDVQCSDRERDYLIDGYNQFFSPPVGADDIIWTYAGVRPLIDDGNANLSEITRDYVLETEPRGSGGLVTVYGGKLTTHRKLAGDVMAELAGLGANPGPEWTGDAPLHGGAMSRPELSALAASETVLEPAIRERWVFTYGSEAAALFAAVRAEPALSAQVVPGIPEAELIHAVETEDARTAEDFLYRRTKLFLSLDPPQTDTVKAWFETYLRAKESSDEHGHDHQAG